MLKKVKKKMCFFLIPGLWDRVLINWESICEIL